MISRIEDYLEILVFFECGERFRVVRDVVDALFEFPIEMLSYADVIEVLIDLCFGRVDINCVSELRILFFTGFLLFVCEVQESGEKYKFTLNEPSLTI